MSKIIISTDFTDKDIKTTMVFKVHSDGTIEVIGEQQEKKERKFGELKDQIKSFDNYKDFSDYLKLHNIKVPIVDARFERTYQLSNTEGIKMVFKDGSFTLRATNDEEKQIKNNENRYNVRKQKIQSIKSLLGGSENYEIYIKDGSENTQIIGWNLTKEQADKRCKELNKILAEQEVIEFVKKHYPNATLGTYKSNWLMPDPLCRITADKDEKSKELSGGFTPYQAWTNAKKHIEKELADKAKQATQELFEGTISKPKLFSELVDKAIRDRYSSTQVYPDTIILHPMDRDRLVVNSAISKIHFQELNITLKVLTSDQLKEGEIIVR